MQIRVLKIEAKAIKNLKKIEFVHFLQKINTHFVQFYNWLKFCSHFGHNRVVEYSRREKDPKLTKLLK